MNRHLTSWTDPKDNILAVKSLEPFNILCMTAGTFQYIMHDSWNLPIYYAWPLEPFIILSMTAGTFNILCMTPGTFQYIMHDRWNLPIYYAWPLEPFIILSMTAGTFNILFMTAGTFQYIMHYRWNLLLYYPWPLEPSIYYAWPLEPFNILCMGVALMCKSPRAEQVTDKMLHFQCVLTNYTNFYLQNKMHLSTCLTYILSLSIFFFIMYNPVIVIWTNYFVLWNDVHITI